MNQSLILISPPGLTEINTRTITQWYYQVINNQQPPQEIISLAPLAEKNSIGITQVRQVIKQLSFKTSSQNLRLVIINQAHRLTHEAQNSLLKTLEEPPPYTTIILETPYPKQLLPTIQSRCVAFNFTNQTNQHQEDQDLANTSDLITLPFKSYSQAISLAQKYQEREAAIEFLTQLLTHSANSAQARSILLALDQLKANLNVRLTLEQLFFRWVSPRQSVKPS